MLGCRMGGDERGDADTERITDGTGGNIADDRALLGFHADLGWFQIIQDGSTVIIPISVKDTQMW